jgi:hypothetical protein
MINAQGEMLMKHAKMSMRISFSMTVIWTAFCFVGALPSRGWHGLEGDPLLYTFVTGVVVIWVIWFLFKDKIDEKFD